MTTYDEMQRALGYRNFDRNTIDLKKSVEYAIAQSTKNESLVEEYRERLKNVKSSLLTSTEKALLSYAKNPKFANIPLVDVDEAFRISGFLPFTSLPRLAIVTYKGSLERKNLKVYMWENGSASFSSKKTALFADYSTPNGIFKSTNDYTEAVTSVPLVPPELRQSDSKDVYVLFEVSNWKETTPQPVDPYLLKRIDGSLFAILGTWDLTQHEIDTYQACKL